MTETICAECRTPLEESDSERGRWFCPECTAPRGRQQDYLRPCRCCGGIYVDPGDLCEWCDEAGCSRNDLVCKYTSEMITPDECDHTELEPISDYFAICTTCGHRTLRESDTPYELEPRYNLLDVWDQDGDTCVSISLTPD